MGNYIAYLWYDSKEVNSMTELTRFQVYLVQRSWKMLNADPITGGALIFKKLFTAYPETREFFRTIREVPVDGLAQNRQFKAHALNFMSSFNLFVSNLPQPEIAAALMAKLGESHGRRKIREEHFKGLKVVLNGILREDLNLDDATVEAWDKTIDFMCTHVFQELNKTAGN